MSEVETIAALQVELEKRVAADQFSGAVLIAKASKPVFQRAYGDADRNHKARNTLDTKFRNGSMSKVFTGVVVGQLGQAGKMRFEDPISKYIPDNPNHDVAAVTIHQLLTHTGGTGESSPPARRRFQEGPMYAYGFFERETPDRIRTFGYTGGARGMNGSLSIFPASQYVAVILANMDPPAANQVADFVERRLPLT
jgi:CubicO group peptidase (beta-lactamase class C family)